MEVSVLGPVAIRGDAGPVGAGGTQQRRILTRLALGAGHVVTIAALEQAAYGDELPRSARHSIATHVFRLRALGLDIATVDDGYQLNTPTDVLAFEHAAAAAGAVAAGAVADDDPVQLVARLRSALLSWRGAPFVDLADLPEAMAEGARLGEIVESLREALLAAELEVGPNAAAPSDRIAEARRLALDQPYRERRWELLMLALYRAGRQADALTAYAECRRLLVDDLGIEPGPGLRSMQQAVLAQHPSLDRRTSDARDRTLAGSLPPRGVSTRLVGREVERQDLEDAWTRARLVTIVGPPGAGKTRLAVEWALSVPAPVWYVGLEQVPADQSVASAVLGVVAPSSRAADALNGVIDALRETAGLLVIDGCDLRLAEARTVAAAVLRHCPGVRVLATSQERLGERDEALVSVRSLSPDEAVALLADRARLSDPRFTIDPGDVRVAERLCDLVDRLPLGIELVARHLNALHLNEMVARVEADLHRWAGGRTGATSGLWAALDASVARLGAAERRVLVAMAVMVADADLALIGEVSGAGPAPADAGVDTFDAVAHLVDANLARIRSAPGASRYELFRTAAVHALSMTDRREIDETEQRYHDAVAARASALAAQIATSDRATAIGLLELDMAHVRAVLGAASRSHSAADVEPDLRLAVALNDYWLGHHPAEGIDWIARLVDVVKPGGALLADALLAEAHLAYWLTDFQRGQAAGERARSTFAALGDAAGEGRALRRLGAIAAATDDMDNALSFLQASLVCFERAGQERETGTTLLHLGSLLADESRVAEARPLLERALAIALAGGDPLARAHVLAALTLAYWRGADLENALTAGREALELFRSLGHRPTEGSVAYRLAAVARGLGRPRAARRYAQLAIEAGEAVSTRTTVALGHLNMARLDLDADELASAARHMATALELMDPVADRWVLVEALEALARLLAMTGRDGAARLLAYADGLREEIRQPVAPTERADVDRLRHQVRVSAAASSGAGDPVDALAAYGAATAFVRPLLRRPDEPIELRIKAASNGPDRHRDPR